MALDLVQRYNAPDLAVQVDSGARAILPGTNISFSVDPVTGAITINGTGGVGTVTSVGATGSTGLTVGGSPITTAGVLTFTLSANLQGWSGINPATGVGGPYVIKAGDTMTGTLNGTSIVLSGNLIAGGSVTTVQNFVASGVNVVLGTTGAGSVFLRPNGPGSVVGELTINSAGATVVNGSIGINGNTIVNGADLYSYRAGGASGVIFLNSAATRYLYYDGTKYILNAAALEVGGNLDAGGRLAVNTLATTPVYIQAHPTFGANYGAIMSAGQSGTEYHMLMSNKAADVNTYVSASTGGNVVLRPNANSTTGEVVVSPAGLTINPATGGKLLSKISLGTAAPGALANGELYLRY